MRRAGLRGLAALPRRARTTDSRHGCPIGPNRRARNFEAAAPGQAWLADLTCIPTGEGWSCLAAILGMHTRRIVCWSMRQTLHTEIALDALNMAVRCQADRARPATTLPRLLAFPPSDRKVGALRSIVLPKSAGSIHWRS